MRYIRPKAVTDGGKTWVYLAECVCEKDQRGPKDGVCGCCGKAIPGKNGR